MKQTIALLTTLLIFPPGEMLQRYCNVGPTLDPFPYTGGTTSLLASWMGGRPSRSAS